MHGKLYPAALLSEGSDGDEHVAEALLIFMATLSLNVAE
jgi:hypothetical protein